MQIYYCETCGLRIDVDAGHLYKGRDGNAYCQNCRPDGAVRQRTGAARKTTSAIDLRTVPAHRTKSSSSRLRAVRGTSNAALSRSSAQQASPFKWIMVGAVLALVAACAGILLIRPGGTTPVAPPAPSVAPEPPLPEPAAPPPHATAMDNRPQGPVVAVRDGLKQMIWDFQTRDLSGQFFAYGSGIPLTIKKFLVIKSILNDPPRTVVCKERFVTAPDIALRLGYKPYADTAVSEILYAWNGRLGKEKKSISFISRMGMARCVQFHPEVSGDGGGLLIAQLAWTGSHTLQGLTNMVNGDKRIALRQNTIRMYNGEGDVAMAGRLRFPLDRDQVYLGFQVLHARLTLQYLKVEEMPGQTVLPDAREADMADFPDP